MTTMDLTQRDCIALIRTHPSRGLVGRVFIDRSPPITLSCFVLDNGDLLIPTGSDRTLAQSAHGHRMRIEFAADTGDGGPRWQVVEAGWAYKISGRDARMPSVHTVGALGLPDAFENGLRVRADYFTGWISGDT